MLGPCLPARQKKKQFITEHTEEEEIKRKMPAEITKI
jgi:hypothetical protein